MVNKSLVLLVGFILYFSFSSCLSQPPRSVSSPPSVQQEKSSQDFTPALPSISTELFSYTQVRDLYRQSLNAFSAADFSQARQGFEAVDTWLTAHPEFALYFDHQYRGFSFVWFVDEYQRLIQASDYTTFGKGHRILVLIPSATDAVWQSQRIAERVTEADIQTLRVSCNLMSMLYAVATGGALRISYEFIRVESVVREIEAYGEGPRRTLHAVLDSLAPYPAELLVEKLASFDTLMLYWKSGPPGNSSGSADYPTAMGTMAPLPLVKDFLQIPGRGKIIISSALAERTGTLFHEFFHVIEKANGIQPIHGFLESSPYPNWPGGSEMDYYLWHLRVDGSLRQALAGGQMSFHQRFPLEISQKQFEEIRQYAAQPGALTKAEFLQRIQSLHAAAKYTEALSVAQQLNSLAPYDRQSLYWLGVQYARNNQKPQAVEFFSKQIFWYPESPEAYVYRATLLADTAILAAIADFRAALRLGSPQRAFISSFLKGHADRENEHAQAALEEFSALRQ